MGGSINTLHHSLSSSFHHEEHNHQEPGECRPVQAGKDSKIRTFLIFLLQVLSTIISLLPGFTGGAAISYAAVALPFYMDPDNGSGLIMTKDQASWFGKVDSYENNFCIQLSFSEPELSNANGWELALGLSDGQVWSKDDPNWELYGGDPCFRNSFLGTHL